MHRAGHGAFSAPYCMQQEGWALTWLLHQLEANIHMLPENGPQGILSDLSDDHGSVGPWCPHQGLSERPGGT